MRFSVLVLSAAIFISVFCGSASAGLSREQATFLDSDCMSPTLASSPDGFTALAFEIAANSPDPETVAVQIFSTEKDGDQVMPQPQVMGEGHAPVLTFSRTGFHLAYISNDLIMAWHADAQGNWDIEPLSILISHGTVLSVDIWGNSAEGTGADVFMTVEIVLTDGSDEHQVLFASCTDLVWSVLDNIHLDTNMTTARLTGITGSDPMALVFYIKDDGETRVLKGLSNVSGSWYPPTEVTDSPVWGDYDVLHHGFLSYNILGLGQQPACPCGSIYHQSATYPGTWEEPEELTVEHSSYNWPSSPCLASDQQQEDSPVIHAFWVQDAAAYDMTPLRRTLEYQILEDGTWTDASGFLNEPGLREPFGPDVAIAVDPSPYPVLAWTRTDTIDGTPYPAQVWIARNGPLSAVSEHQISQTDMALQVCPNPFNPSTTISFYVARETRASLNIFDVSGRLVRTLLDQGTVHPGRNQFVWNGAYDNGLSAASGVYFCKLQAGDYSQTQRLSLVK